MRKIFYIMLALCMTALLVSCSDTKPVTISETYSEYLQEYSKNTVVHFAE